jgi:FPC/CPF motif-containing protein YcgG
MLAEFGERSEASQYSGRRVEPGWQCPFHAARAGQPPEEPE